MKRGRRKRDIEKLMQVFITGYKPSKKPLPSEPKKKREPSQIIETIEFIIREKKGEVYIPDKVTLRRVVDYLKDRRYVYKIRMDKDVYVVKFRKVVK